jgi:predicted protein tyrosine phosphatase
MALSCHNISALEIASMKKLPPNWKCISVNEEYSGYYPIGFEKGNESRILRVRFSDVTYPIKKAGFDHTFNPISGDTVQLIRNFVEENKDHNFLLHCQAGVSRSSAICLYIHIAYGHNLRENFWQVSRPNKYVLGALLVSQLYSNHLKS